MNENQNQIIAKADEIISLILSSYDKNPDIKLSQVLDEFFDVKNLDNDNKKVTGGQPSNHNKAISANTTQQPQTRNEAKC